MSRYKPWTSRDVVFEMHPSNGDDRFEEFIDALCDKYWDRWYNRLFFMPGLGSHSRDVHIDGWPLWIPKWVARRSVVKVAVKTGVTGEAEYRIRRVVL